MWQEPDGFRSYEFRDTGIVFNTEKATIAYGFAVARLRVDREL
jgi:hypothetical protein